MAPFKILEALVSAAFVVRPTTKMIRTSYIVVILLVAGVFFGGGKYGIARETQYALLAIPAILLLVTLWRHFSRRFVRLTIVDGRLRYQSGILSRTTRTLELTRIQDVRADQRFGQRLLGIGDITVETAGESGRLEIEDVDSPQAVAERILDAARSNVRPAGA